MEKIKRTILCVDDDPDTCEMLTVVFGFGGYEAISTDSIVEALGLAIAHNVDLVLLDWVLKDGTGVELCRALRSKGVTAPILFYSGIDIGSELLDEALGAGAQGFLTKPVDVHTILQRVSDLIGQPRADH